MIFLQNMIFPSISIINKNKATAVIDLDFNLTSLSRPFNEEYIE